MTAKTLEQEAREAAEAYVSRGNLREHDEQFGCGTGFAHGYLAAAAARDKEIEELRARVKELEEYANLVAIPYGFREDDEEARLKELRSRLMVPPIPLPEGEP